MNFSEESVLEYKLLDDYRLNAVCWGEKMSNHANRYKDASRPTTERVADLLANMTLEEKVAQLCMWWHTNFFMPDFDAALEKTLQNGLGGINWLIPGFAPEENTSVLNRIQQFTVEKTRLGIPVLFTGEALAGGLFYGATCFPTAIGLASTWEPELIDAMCRIVREQMVEYGVRLVYSPVVDIARDPRWGRIGETYGEDPYLVSQIGIAYVKAMQGTDLKQAVACTGKHFLAYAAGEGGINKGAVSIGYRELYEIYARPFEAVIRDGGVRAIMNSHSVIDNVPVAGSRAILTDLLKNKLGFYGVVFSDAGVVEQMMTRNQSAATLEEAVVRALKAGIDIEISEPPVYSCLKDSVENGSLDVSFVNDAVSKVLTVKFDLGLFENPYAGGEVRKVVYTARNYAQAQITAVKSLVLLKNEGNLLPLSQDISSVAVIGPNSNGIRCFFGGYSPVAMRELTVSAFSRRLEDAEQVDNLAYGLYGDPSDPDSFAHWFYPDTKSVLQAISSIVSEKTVLHAAQGCTLAGEETGGFAGAVDAAGRSDVAIVVLGGVEGMGTGTTCGEGRDLVTVALPGVQQQLLEAVCSTGKPVVLVVISSNPLDLTWAKSHVSAIIQAWSPGQAAGSAIANVLFGLDNPGGKLPLTMIKNVGQIPLYYNHKPVFEGAESIAANVDGKYSCLYPFGHGLSYTEFVYSALVLQNRQVDTAGSVVLSFTVQNVGSRPGDEVAQVYFHDCAASVSRPVMELVAFKRIRLDPGEKCTMTITVQLEMLAFYDADMHFVIEPGKMEVLIGSSSEDIRLTETFEVTGNTLHVEQRRVFSSKVTALMG